MNCIEVKNGTYLCVQITLLDCHCAALGGQHPDITKQPLVSDWLATPEHTVLMNRIEPLYCTRSVME